MKTDELISEDSIDSVWGSANFGSMSRRDIIRYSLLKCASGYYTGHTAKQILSELGLVTQKWTLTKLGKQYLFAAFSNGNSI